MYLSAVQYNNKISVWERLPDGRVFKQFKTPYYFYIIDIKGKYKDIFGNKLRRLDFNNYREYKNAIESYQRDGQRLFESDIRPEYKILAEHYHGTDVPATHFTLFDIEVDYDKTLGYSDVDSREAPINAITLHHYWMNTTYTLVVPPSSCPNICVDALDVKRKYPDVEIRICENEKELIKQFYQLIADSDILTGWNSSPFDTPYVYERAKRVMGETFANKLSFAGAPPPKYREVRLKNGMTVTILDLFGRESVDYLEVFKKFEVVERRSYALESIAEEMLPELPKLEYDGSLADLYSDDFDRFVQYNIRDCEILKGLEDKLGYIQLAIQFAHSSCGMLRDVTGTIKLAELAIVNFCHTELDARVPDFDYEKLDIGGKFTGALVLPPQVGMHDWVASIDVASLYPSVMRAVNISPDTVMGQFVDNHNAFTAIRAESEQLLSFRYEDGNIEEYSAKEWKRKLNENRNSISGYGTVFSMKKQGFIPSILENWFEQRRVFKKKAAEAKRLLQETDKSDKDYSKYKTDCDNYNRLQYIFKIRLNSLYGALGNPYFKFYDVRLAESTTRSGQEVLMHMVRTVAENLDGIYMYPSESTVYSDTDSSYFLTHATDFEQALQIAKAVAKKVNKSFAPFCRDAFFCEDGYDSLITAELDVIASKSIFIKKKYYVMQLAYADGSTVDKIKLMGVQLKKTTIPKAVAVRLTQFVQDLLKGRPWNKIGREIAEYNDYIINEAPLDLIGLPKGINGLEDKEDEYRTRDASVALSGHAAAAIFYNLCLEKYGDTESMRIRSGMKLRVYYLTKKYGRFSSIALPTDLKHIPEWFTEHFCGMIDRAHQAEVMIHKPLASILDAIDEIVPTHQSLMFDELMEY